MTRKRFKYIIFPHYRWYISGRFIRDARLDYKHCKIKQLPPYRSDAVPCNKKYCRYCWWQYYL